MIKRVRSGSMGDITALLGTFMDVRRICVLCFSNSGHIVWGCVKAVTGAYSIALLLKSFNIAVIVVS